MAFWQEPPQYMIERERRLYAIEEPIQRPLTPVPEPTPIIESVVRIEESDDEVQEKSNFKLQSKEKLEELGKYVINHIFRKIRTRWPKIQEAFNDKRKADSRRAPARPTRAPRLQGSATKVSLRLSKVLAAFCSTEANVELKDTLKVLREMGCSESSIALSTKIFAAGIESEFFGDVELEFIQQIEEEMISEEQVMNVLFHVDPERRNIEMQQAISDYALVVSEANEKVRKKKSIEDKKRKRAARNHIFFEQALLESHPPKGPLHGVRLSTLFSLYTSSYLHLHQERIAEAMEIIHHYRTLLYLTGEDIYSDRYIQTVKSPQFLDHSSPLDHHHTPSPFLFHSIHLAGTPPLLTVFRQLVSSGRGLDGLTYDEVSELVQAFAATKIQSHVRMHLRCRRFFAARRKWARLFFNIKRSHFNAWCNYTKMMLKFRRCCLRKIVAWRYYTKERKRVRELFRCCYWPLFVWRRYAVASATAAEKVKFLVTRVYPTYVQLKVFQAWKKVIQQRSALHRKADNCLQRTLNKRKLDWFVYWNTWSHQRKALRQSWFKSKFYERHHNIILKKLSFFQIWKGYTSFRIEVKRRVKLYTGDFRKLLMKGAYPRNYYDIYRDKHVEIAEYKRAVRQRTEDKLRKKTEKKKKMFQDADSNLFSLNDKEADDGSRDDDGHESGHSSDSEEAPLLVMRFHQKEQKVFSNWRVFRPPDTYDIDTEGELAELPESLVAVYNQCVPPLSDIRDAEVERWDSPFVREKFGNVIKNFAQTEAWALLEEAMVFQRAASKAFRHIHLHAVFRIRVRKAYAVYRFKLLRLVFNALYDWMHRVGIADKSDAEALAQQARAARLANLERRRQLQKAVLRQKDDRGQIVLLPSIDSTVDLLEMDREERYEEILQVKNMIKLSNSYQQHCNALVDKNTKEHGRQALTLKKDLTGDLFQEVSTALELAKTNEIEFANNYKINCVKKLVDVLVNVYEAAQLAYTWKLVKVLFRYLRMPLLKKRSIYMRNRAMLKNYIRVCKRLVSLSNCVYKYKDLRSIWVMFNRWLKLIERNRLDTSPGLILRTKRTMEMYRGFDDAIKEQGFQVLVYPMTSKLLPVTIEFRQLFLRWKMYTQENKLLIDAHTRAESVSCTKMLRRYFTLLKYRNREYVLPLVPAVIKCPALVRAENDLDQILKRFIAVRRSLRITKIRILNRQFMCRMMQFARKALTFKGFIKKLNEDVNRRLATEMAVLSDAFEDRGGLGFIDMVNMKTIPDSMLRMPGTHFSDPTLGLETAFVPGGYKLSTLVVVLQDAQGIVGWQLIWRADSAPDIIGVKRGKWSGAALSIEEINVPHEDFIKAVDYYYEGIIIFGIRLELYFGGWTHWVGGKNSMSTLTLHLDALESALPPDEDDLYSFEDEGDSAFKKRYIIGFTGVETSLHATGLGIVVRNVTNQHIFSYHWIDEAIHREADKLEQKKRQERLRKEREQRMNRKLKSQKSNKVSLPQIINQQIISKLSKNVKWNKGVTEAITNATSKLFSNSLEQYFDVTRMRSKEVQSALLRTEDFAIRLWADRSISNNPELSPLVTLNVISGLARWYFSALSKHLMQDFSHASDGTQLILESMQIHNKADADLRESSNINMAAMKLEQDSGKRPWEKKYLLSPEDRKLKREHELLVEQKRKVAINMIRNADAKDAEAFEMYKRGRALLPKLTLGRAVCYNYIQKLEAARHKAVLLERMTIAEVKESLNGVVETQTEVLSSESMVVVQTILSTKKKVEGYTQLLDDVEVNISEERDRLLTTSNEAFLSSLRGTHRRNKFIPNPITVTSSRVRNERGERVLVRPPRVHRAVVRSLSPLTVKIPMSDDLDEVNSDQMYL